MGFSSRTGSSIGAEIDRELASLNSSLRTGSSLTPGLGLSGTSGHSAASSSYKSEQYSSSSSSVNGGIPKHESSYDSTYRSRAVGDSGIPHTSYAHSSGSYSSDRPSICLKADLTTPC